MNKIKVLSASVLACVLGATMFAEPVEISLVSKLDGVTNNYCVDVAGGGEIDPSKGLQAHTCYSYRGELGEDQAFESEKFEENMLYLGAADVCAEVSSLEAGAEVGLATCDGNELQQISFMEDGTIRPVAAEGMCFTAGEDTRFGRSDVHQIKELTLQECSDDLADSQTWYARTEME